MSRAFLILTTQPAPANTDPSERGAVLAARREATVDAQVAAELRAPGRGRRRTTTTPRRSRHRGDGPCSASSTGWAACTPGRVCCGSGTSAEHAHARDAGGVTPRSPAPRLLRHGNAAADERHRPRPARPRGRMSAFDDLLPAVDARFERLASEAKIPGVAWGVVRDGALSHAGGAGTIRDGEDRRPDADSVYRIASMTKSFTATAILLLRDEGRLGLDDPVGDARARAGRLGAADGRLAGDHDPPPADDVGRPRDRRSVGRPAAGPARSTRSSGSCAAGPPFAWPPGTTFEYSNLGYGILGRVVTAAGGQEYGDLVRDRILGPLGMTSTAYHAADVPEARLAHGYVRRDGALIREGERPVRRAGVDGRRVLDRPRPRPLGRRVPRRVPRPRRPRGRPPAPARRRAGRCSRRTASSCRSLPARPAHAAPVVDVMGYGFGLVVHADTELGTIVVARRRLPGLRVAHGLAPRDRPRASSASATSATRRVRPVVAEQLRALVLADAVAAPAAAAGARRPRRSARSSRACSSAGTTRSPTGPSR